MSTESRSNLFGRRMIFTDVEEITDENVLSVLNKALETHETNKEEIQYLYDYYKGKQAVLNRKKEYRKEINNKIVENRANEIVSFKVGYLMGEPVQYVNRGSDNISDELNLLNEYVFAASKAKKDKELAEWFTIAGTAYRMVLPCSTEDPYEAPFEIYTLDPRDNFMVYHSGLGNKAMMSVKSVTKSDDTVVRSIYTKYRYYEVENDKITKNVPHFLGRIPVIEYPANTARLGAFEIVLSILDAINEVASNRIDGIEQFIQAILMFKGVDIDSKEFKALKEEGGIKVPLEGDLKYLTQELNQMQTQTLVDYMYETVLTICGMPNRNGGSSTSDTGAAVIMRDGWSAAEARAKDAEKMFEESENMFLRLVIDITNTLRGTNLKPSSIGIRFTRRNYENIQEKAQVLTTMLNNDKIHPRLAFEHCGMFADPELAYTQSMKYAEEKKKETEKSLIDFANKQIVKEKAKINNNLENTDDV